MTRKYSQAQNKATQKYIKNAYDEVKLRLPKGEKDKIKAHAESRFESVNAFINRAITETMTRDKIEQTLVQVGEDVSPHPETQWIQKIKELKEQRKKQGE